ncbi:hypothetical protein Q8A73_001905 [Channa argus]|nr:hypothetical protein Q8A73_001905 [Channa argus]
MTLGEEEALGGQSCTNTPSTFTQHYPGSGRGLGLRQALARDLVSIRVVSRSLAVDRLSLVLNLIRGRKVVQKVPDPPPTPPHPTPPHPSSYPRRLLLNAEPPTVLSSSSSSMASFICYLHLQGIYKVSSAWWE